MKAPIFIGELELTEPVTGLELPVRPDGAAYTQVRLLVRMQGIPVGYAFLAPEATDAASVAGQVWAQLGAAVNARRTDRGLAALDALPAGTGRAWPGWPSEHARRGLSSPREKVSAAAVSASWSGFRLAGPAARDNADELRSAC